MKLINPRLLLALGLLTAACGGGTGDVVQPPPPPPPVPVVARVAVEPVAFTLNVGAIGQLQASAFDAAGTAINGAVFSYTSSAPAIATVSTTGTITGLLPGAATITTTSGSKTADAAVTVQLAPVGNVTLTISRTLLKESDTVSAIAVVRDEQNQVITRDIVWSSSDSSVAVVTPLGLILGLVSGGPVTISATAGGKSGSVIIAVIPATVQLVEVLPDTADLVPGSTKQMTATASDEFGNAVTNRSVTWASFLPNVATVDSTGLVTAVALGESTISATIGGVTGQSLVRVAALTEAHFRIEVTNHLLTRVDILQNGVAVGRASAGGSATIERPLTPTLTLSWQALPVEGRGETFGESYAPILNPTGVIALDIDNVLDDGRVFFNPVLRNVTASKVLADFPLRDTATQCLCTITTGSQHLQYGYWLWSAAAQLRVYQLKDLNLAGPFLSFPVPLAALEPRSGIWRFTLLVGP